MLSLVMIVLLVVGFLDLRNRVLKIENTKTMKDALKDAKVK